MGTSQTIGIVWPGPPVPDDIEEMQHFMPPGVKFHMVGTRPQSESPSPGGITLERLLRMPANHNIEEAAKALVPLAARAVGYGCTSASYVRGVGGDRDISDRMTAATGLPVTTTSSAAVEALRHLGVRRVAVLSPHVDELNERLTKFLEGNELDAVHMRGLNKLSGIEKIPQEDIRDLVIQLVDRPDADGIFISCTGMRTSAIFDSMEERTGKPVVSALQATVWETLRIAGIAAEIPGVGKLYHQPVPV